jgi:hypothetical protein
VPAHEPDSREESQAQRDDRNLAELLQELRVAGLGVQVLFGFLLSLPFTNRFSRLSGIQQDLYLTCLVLSAVATALLLGPVAYHRVVFRRGLKEGLIRAASVMATAGLATVGLAVSDAVLLVTSFVAGGLAGTLIAVLVACMFGLLWFAFPAVRRHQGDRGPLARQPPARRGFGSHLRVAERRGSELLQSDSGEYAHDCDPSRRTRPWSARRPRNTAWTCP